MLVCVRGSDNYIIFTCSGPIPVGTIVGVLLAISLIGTVAIVAVIIILW